MSTDLKWENGSSENASGNNVHRTLGMSDADATQLARKLTELRTGAQRCELCGWRAATLVHRRRQFACASCAQDDADFRRYEAVSLRLRRREQ
ncbi:MAG: hypothetical protein H0X67_02450 [Acidobacteria bacterium]|nr:hypothetical protein [Acidobacteriota bacterium]